MKTISNLTNAVALEVNTIMDDMPGFISLTITLMIMIWFAG